MSTADPQLFPDPSLQDQVSRLTAELERERVAHKETRKARGKMRHKLLTYERLNGIYISLKQAAEHAAQAPIDDHYRDVLDVLETIALDETACSCHVRSWHGEGHDTQCPVRIATDAHPLLRQARERAKAGAA
jgi:hypothetical protein